MPFQVATTSSPCPFRLRLPAALTLPACDDQQPLPFQLATPSSHARAARPSAALLELGSWLRGEGDASLHKEEREPEPPAVVVVPVAPGMGPEVPPVVFTTSGAASPRGTPRGTTTEARSATRSGRGSPTAPSEDRLRHPEDRLRQRRGRLGAPVPAAGVSEAARAPALDIPGEARAPLSKLPLRSIPHKSGPKA